MKRTTPLMLIKQAQIWEGFYNQAVEHPKKMDALLPGLYCLFISLEMRLKAYIILLDKSYASPAKLRKLGHSFQDIYDVIFAIAPSEISKEVMEYLKAYNLFNNNVNDLRYPETPRGLQIDQDLQTGNHKLKHLFSTIDSEVQNGFIKWLKEEEL